MSFLKELRDTAQRCGNVLTDKMLRDSADEIALCAKEFSSNPTGEKLSALNCARAKASRTLRLAEVIVDPGPGGASLPMPRRMAA